jgi:hypothetical protein
MSLLTVKFLIGMDFPFICSIEVCKQLMHCSTALPPLL